MWTYCREITRDDPYMLGRIIARPFVGTNAKDFERTSNRHDYALKPFDKTVMNHLQNGGFDSIALGKISDIFRRRRGNRFGSYEIKYGWDGQIDSMPRS